MTAICAPISALRNLLSKYGLTGTFYIPKQYADPTMSPEQVQRAVSLF